ncbi:MAG TPA: CvpA family protein [Phycisphaerae bacterium]|nr:CvpA family protein [Phycisphaerae bacterium]
MLLIVLAFLLILGIAFYQVIQGLYSALIMAILSIVSAVIAFNFYEPAAAMLYENQPAHADAAALIALFVVPLLAMRVLCDLFLRRNVVFGVWVDRIGGGAVGILVGMIMVGVLTVAMQMLPLGAKLFTYRPYDDTLRRDQALAPFYPDEFVIGLANFLSAGAFAGEQRLDNVHDDLLLELYCARNQMEQTYEEEREQIVERVGRVDAVPDSLSVVGVYPTPSVIENDPDAAPSNPLLDDNTLTRIIVVRVKVNESARNESEDDNWWRLPATHFRLVTRDKEGEIQSHYPVAYLTWGEGRIEDRKMSRLQGTRGWRSHPAEKRDDKRPLIGKLGVQRPWQEQGGPADLTIDWVYRIGREQTPESLIFRRVAKSPTGAIHERRLGSGRKERDAGLFRSQKVEE